MELDELKRVWKETTVQNNSTSNMMEMIQNKNYGPLAALKSTYRRQIIVMALIPFLLLMTNLQEVHKVLTSILFWSYVGFCIVIVLFASYNYNIVRKMQAMDVAVKTNLEQQINLLGKRANTEVLLLRVILLFFILLAEVTPYLQHYRMLDKWHSLSLPVRLGAYVALILLQYFLNRQLKEKKVGRHLTYLQNLVQQMQ